MDTTENTIHNRCYYVLDRMLELIPDEARDHPLAQMLTFFLREGKKDIRRIPEEFISELSLNIGNAFTWVAEGDMNDIEEIEAAAESFASINFNEYEEDYGGHDMTENS